jgi:hypothetical protein
MPKMHFENWGGFSMQDRRQIEVKRQSVALQHQGNALKNNNKNFVILDSLWDQTPEMGLEGWVATITDQTKLLKALRINIQKNKQRRTRPQYD